MPTKYFRKDKFTRANKNVSFSTHNSIGTILVLGCVYYTTWQNSKTFNFMLIEVKGKKAMLKSTLSGKEFWTNLDDLILVESAENLMNVDKLRPIK